MTADSIRHLAALSDQLAETLMTAALCAKEIRDAVRAVHDDKQQAHGSHRNCRENVPQANNQRPLLDESTLSVMWKDQSVHLGNTLLFRLMDRLARRPNQYVTHLDLLCDVWDNEQLETSSIRSAVRRLRKKLRDGGMETLAVAIRGHNGRYILEL